MSAKRLAVLAVPVLVLVSSALAQVNEFSVTAGRTFVSTRRFRTRRRTTRIPTFISGTRQASRSITVGCSSAIVFSGCTGNYP